MNKHTIEEKISNWHASKKSYGNIVLQGHSEDIISLKDKIPFVCVSCNTGKTGLWKMQLNNVLNGVGCPVCKSIDEVKLLFSKSILHENNTLKIINIQIEKPNVPSIGYIIVDSGGKNSRKFNRNELRGYIKSYEFQSESRSKLEGLIKNTKMDFIKEFPSGDISYYGNKIEGLTTPGYYFKISAKRTMGEHIDRIASLKRVNQLIVQEKKDKMRAKSLIEEGKKNGATNIIFKSMGKKRNVVYLNRFGEERTDSIYRIMTTNWGQGGHKAENLCRAIFRVIFPNHNWAFNIRPDFLNYITSNNLELDGYCEELSIAFEHNGRQHYEPISDNEESIKNFEDIKKRDLFKRKICAERNIKLITVDTQELTVESYSKNIIKLLRNKKINHLGDYNLTKTDIDKIESLWNGYNKNPYIDVQNSVVYSLGEHKLLSPDKDRINRESIVKYRCSHCNKENNIIAKSLTDNKVRKFCNSCKSKGLRSSNNNSKREMVKKISKYIASHIKELENGIFYLVCSRNSEHNEMISNLDEKKLERFFNGESYRCIQCELKRNNLENTSENRASIMTMRQNEDVFINEIAKAGLIKKGNIELRKAVNNKKYEIYCQVSCSKCLKEHVFDLNMRELKRLLKNTYLNDKVVPTRCLVCAYPGSRPNSLQTTVFHRLDFLKKYHPSVVYVDDFDSSGKRMERYNCGERFELFENPHPDFFIRAHTIGSKEKASKFRTPCYVCAVMRDDIPHTTKSIEMIEGRMYIISELLSKKFSALPLLKPSISFANQRDREKQISTTETKLIFHCGNLNHSEEESTIDRYFNKKRGYCKECLKLANIKTIHAEFDI